MKSNLYKRRVLWIAIGVVAVAVAALLIWNTMRASAVKKLDIMAQGLVMGATEDSIYYTCATDTGILYMDGGLMKYCDYTSGESYLLCDQVNCIHGTSTCGAYAKNATALGIAGGKLYALIINETLNTCDLTEMDVNGQNRRSIYSFDMGSYNIGEWFLAGFGDVYYGYGNAYIQVNYQRIESERTSTQKTQLVLVDLSSGAYSIVTEADTEQEDCKLQFQAINENCVVYSLEKSPKLFLDQESFDAARKSGELDLDLEAMLAELPKEKQFSYWKDDLQIFYLEYAATVSYDKTFELKQYVLDSGLTTTIWSGNCSYLYTNGMPCGWWSPCYCLGWFEDDLIVNFWQYDEEGTIHNQLVGISLQGSEIQIHDLYSNYYSMPGMYFGSINNKVFSDGTIILFNRSEDGNTAHMFSFDLTTRTCTPLFDDIANMSFSFLREVGDYYVGCKREGDGHVICMLSKEDYRNGNFDAAIHLLG